MQKAVVNGRADILSGKKREVSLHIPLRLRVIVLAIEARAVLRV